MLVAILTENPMSHDTRPVGVGGKEQQIEINNDSKQEIIMFLFSRKYNYLHPWHSYYYFTTTIEVEKQSRMCPVAPGPNHFAAPGTTATFAFSNK